MSERTSDSSTPSPVKSGVVTADWEFAEETRRAAARSMSPAERLEMLEEIVDFIFSAWELNPQLRTPQPRSAT